MEKFIGKLNGVTYTDLNEFYKALGQLNPDDIKDLSVTHQYTAEQQKAGNQAVTKKPAQATGTSWLDLAARMLLDMLVDNNQKTQKEYFNTYGLKSTKKEQPEKKEEAKKEPRKYTMKELLHFYTFKDTTYTFVGGEQDEQELDKFDELLAKKARLFTEVPWHLYCDNELTDLREELAQRYLHVTDESNKREEKLHEIDKRMEKVEHLLETMDEFGYDTTMPEAEYNELTTKFDIVENERNYFDLLVHYYKELLKVIDAQY